MRLIPAVLLLSFASYALAQIATPPATPPLSQSEQTVPPAGPTLARIRAAGLLRCGVDFEEAEYTNADAHGNHSALDLELCKAIAVAVLGPHAAAKAVPYRDEKEALAGLQKGETEVLATGSVNYLDTAAHHFGFAHPAFYDFQGFLVSNTSGIHSTADLAGKKVCFLVGGEAQDQIQAYMQRHSLKWNPYPFSEEGEMEAALITHNCDTITADVSQLAYERIAFRSMAASYEILPDVVAMDPLAPACRLDDPQWANLVDWVVQALMLAEESGVTQANVAEMAKTSQDMLVRRLLGTDRGYGQYLGLDDAWAARVIAAVGNYGELYDRTLGLRSIMRLPRGANNLYTHGGLMLGEPIR